MSLLFANETINPAFLELIKMSGVQCDVQIKFCTILKVFELCWTKQFFQLHLGNRIPTYQEFKLLEELGCIDAMHAPQGQYAGAVLLGTRWSRFKPRLIGILDEYHRGARFKDLYLLGSRRPIDPERESLEAQNDLQGLDIDPFIGGTLGKLPATEIDMMAQLAFRVRLPDDVTLRIVETDDVLDPTRPSGLRHANTEDTFREWLDHYSPRKGTYLVGTNQPFTRYQTATGQRLARKNVRLIGTGPRAHMLTLAEFLDTLAKQAYEEEAALSHELSRS
jgi:hypothetical protein